MQFNRLYEITPSQRLALESLLLPEPEARQAFERWRDGVELDNIDFATYRLIPALYARHLQGEPHQPHYGRMKGIYRFFHVHNTLLFADTRRAVNALQAEGIQAVALKGLAWALKYYERPALRPMSDTDILVPRRDFPRANEILLQHGWRYQHSDQHRQTYDHSVDLTNDGGRALDLHVRALLEVEHEAFDELVRAGSKPFDWDGLTIGMPCPEHLVINGLINAIRDTNAFRLEWICDLAKVVAAPPGLDWDVVWRTAQIFDIAEPVFEALCIASDVAGLDGVRPFVARLAAPRSQLKDSAADAPLDIEFPRAQTASRIRVCKTAQGHIAALFLHWRDLSAVPQLFAIPDRAAWKRLARDCPRRGAGLLTLNLSLRVPAPGRRMFARPYRALVTVEKRNLPSALAAGTKASIPLLITNRSRQIWASHGATGGAYGVSWHVYKATGELISRDHQRFHFIRPSENHVMFVEPGATVECQLEFTAPDQPGDYVIKIDLVHEFVSWFAERGNNFPQWRLTVSPVS